MKSIAIIILTALHINLLVLASPDDIPFEEEYVYIVQDASTPKFSSDEEGESNTVHNKKIKEFIKNQSQQLIDQNIDASGDIISSGIFSLGMKLRIKKLKAEDVYLDPDKFLEFDNTKNKSPFFRNWYKYNLVVMPIVGSNQVLSLLDGVQMPTKIFPTVGARAGIGRGLEIILPRSIDTFHDDSSSKKLWNHLKDSSRIYRMALPTKAKHFLNGDKYPNGSEYNWKSHHFAIFSLGLNFPTNYVQSGLRAYFLLEGMFHKRMKVFRAADKTFVQVDLANEKENSNELAFETTLGINILETSTTRLHTNIRLLSASRAKIKKDSFKLSYIFDLSYPDAMTALDELLKNNFTKAQLTAIDYTQSFFISNNYKGVILLENHTQDLVSKVYSLNAGIFRNRFSGKLDKISFSLVNFIPDVIKYSVSKSKTQSTGEYQYPYSMPLSRISLTLKKEKKNKILDGLWASKEKSILYNNEHLTYKTLIGQTQKVNQITFQEKVRNEKKSPNSFAKFYEPNKYIYQLIKPAADDLLTAIILKNKCDKDYTMSKHLILQDRAIDTIISNRDNELFLKAFAKIFNSDSLDWWKDKTLRKRKLKQLVKKYVDDLNTSTTVINYIVKMHKLYEELDNHQVVNKLKEYERMSLDQLLKVDKNLITSDISKFDPNSLKKSLIFHLTFSKFVMKSGFIDYLTVLVDHLSPDEYFYGLKLKSEKCDVQVIGSPQKITDPDLMSVQIEEYDLDFWDSY